MSEQYEQWGAQSKLAPTAYQPGVSEPYVSPSGPPPPSGYGPTKENMDPYEGDRFKPRKRVNDPLVLLLFIAQVNGEVHYSCGGQNAHGPGRILREYS